MTMPDELKPIRWKNGILYLLEQRLLPFKEVWVKCDTVEKTAKAIEEMTVRGAPAIGITAAYGVAVGAGRIKTGSPEVFVNQIEKEISRLRKTRPTAVNLFWALDRMRDGLLENGGKPVGVQIKRLEEEAIAIHREDEALCNCLGRYGAEALKGKNQILTHCNTGALATGGQGTALAGILQAAHKNKKLHVWVDETRPYLQGARLTAFELAHSNVPFHLITDNMSAFLMKQKKVDAVIVGADRIVENGDTANKIGTYALAVLAQAHGVPFFVSAPTTTLDLNKKSGEEIIIEQRNPREVTHPQGYPISKEEYPVYNPSFDVTPGKLITGIILETGICKPPYSISLHSAMKKNRLRKSK
jgi:methylthioribose-1-phosphate isomerase